MEGAQGSGPASHTRTFPELVPQPPPPPRAHELMLFVFKTRRKIHDFILLISIHHIVMSFLFMNPIYLAVLEFEQVYLDNLPSAEGYEISYMHRDVVTHIAVTKK